MAAKAKHDKQGSDGFALTGEKVEEVENIQPPKTYEDAYELAKQAGAPFPAIVAGQWALESGWGKHKAGTKYNYFGIKGHTKAVRDRMKEKGVNVTLGTDSLDKATGSVDKYMDFDSPLDAFKGYVAFIETNPIYSKALSAGSAEEYLREIKAAGYAEDKNYVSKISNIITNTKGGGAERLKETPSVNTTVDTKTKAVQVYNSEKGKYVTLYAKQDENGKFTYSSQDESIMPKAQAEEVGRAFFESAGDYDRGESGGKTYFNIPTTGGTYQTYDRPNFEKLPLEKRQELSNLKQQQRKAELRDSKDIIADRDKVDDIKSLSKDYDEWKRLQKELKAAERVGLPAEIKKYRDAEAAARNKYLQNNKNYLANEYQRRVNGAVGRQQEIKQELERLERDGTDISERMSLYEEYDNLDFYVDDIQQRKEYLSSSEGKSREKYNPVEWFSAGNLGSGKRQKGTYGTTRAQYAESVAGLENNDNVVSQIRNKYNPDEEAMVESETVATKIANEVSQVPLSVQQRNKAEADKKANQVISDDAPPTKEEADKANINRMKGNEEYLAANLDMTTVSDEEIDAFLNRSEEIQKATGVKGLVEKFGGMDNVMMMAGNMAAYKALSEPMPQQRKSAEWQNYMDTMKTRAQMGISPESLTLMQRNAERTYAGDVSNIGRMATSGQAALGALGQASQRKYQADMEMGVKDAEARERNFNAYGSALAQDEEMTQSYWERNVYNEADRKRELKGALIQSSVENARKEALRKAEIAPTSYRGKLERARLENIELQNRHMAYSQLYAQKKGEALSPLAIEDNEKEQTDE
jgi:hypothetical protein